MKERIKSIDCMRGVAILAVLLIHTTTRTLEASNFNLTGFTWTLFLNQIVRFAVPLFFIISGFVLEVSNREESYWSFIKKRFSKIFLPYTFWSAFYYFLVYNQNHENIFKVILTGDASYQLYFIPTLCIFYLLFPLLHKFYKYFASPIILIFLGGLQIYLLYFDYFTKQLKFSDPVHIAILAYFFFILGIVSAKNKNIIDVYIKRFKLILPVLTLFSGLFVFWEGKSRYLSTGNYLSYYSQWRPSVFIYTLLIALTLYYLFEHTKLGESFIARFSKHSFFVFFVHVAVLELFWKYIGIHLFSLTGSNLGKIIFDPLFFGIIALVSFVIAKILHKIPKSIRLLG